jgi:hypothetical protein
MVQYVLTPWRDRQELLIVRHQFYPAAPPRPTGPSSSAHQHSVVPQVQEKQPERQKQSTDNDDQNQAVARVSMWMQRGNCPHMIESTALLTAAILNDGAAKDGSSTYAVRAAYSAAFSRYVWLLFLWFLFSFFR